MTQYNKPFCSSSEATPGHAGKIISRLAWEELGAPPDKLEEMARERVV